MRPPAVAPQLKRDPLGSTLIMQTPNQSVAYHVDYVPRTTITGGTSSLWWLPPAIVVVFLLVWRPRLALAVTYVAFAAIVAFGMVWFQRGWNQSVSNVYAIAARAADDSTSPVVEGRVENFIPAPAEGHQDERFTVNGVPFAYSDYRITGGFNQTQSHGGPIHDGLRVRIHYMPRGNVIVKLEIAN